MSHNDVVNNQMAELYETSNGIGKRLRFVSAVKAEALHEKAEMYRTAS